MANTKKPIGRLRTKTIMIKLTDGEYKAVKEYCDKYTMKYGAFARSLIMEYIAKDKLGKRKGV